MLSLSSWVSMFPGGREETSCEQDTDLCPLLGCVLVRGGGVLSPESFAAAVFTQNIPQIARFSSASLAYLVQQGGRWLLLCLLQLPSGTGFQFVGCYWTQRFTKTAVFPSSSAMLYNIVPRSPAPLPRPW